MAPPGRPRCHTATARALAYWTTTVLVAAELGLGRIRDLGRTPQVRGVVDHLGYPEYFLGVRCLSFRTMPLWRCWSWPRSGFVSGCRELGRRLLFGCGGQR
jgi:hypothetical protein